LRPLNDAEWLDFKLFVKCRWLWCAHGQGLAGHGCCSAQGEWTRKDCPLFVTDEDYAAPGLQLMERMKYHGISGAICEGNHCYFYNKKGQKCKL
jgi:hypothetical protein